MERGVSFFDAKTSEGYDFYSDELLIYPSTYLLAGDSLFVCCLCFAEAQDRALHAATRLDTELPGYRRGLMLCLLALR